MVKRYRYKILMPDMEVSFKERIAKDELLNILGRKSIQKKRYKMKWI